MLLNPPPLTPERIAAIRSDPRAAKFIRVVMGCKKCPSKLVAYAGLERDPKQEAEGSVWYADLPDRFDCECGSASYDLSSTRRNLAALLGHHVQRGQEEEIAFTPLYSKATFRLS